MAIFARVILWMIRIGAGLLGLFFVLLGLISAVGWSAFVAYTAQVMKQIGYTACSAPVFWAICIFGLLFSGGWLCITAVKNRYWGNI